MLVFWTVFLIGILIMISSILFYFIIKSSIRNGINESDLVQKHEEK